MSATNPRPMIHKYLHFARHSLTTHLHSTFTATLLTFFVARKLISKLFDNAFGLFRCRHLPLEPSGDAFGLFRRPAPLVGALRRHFCPFSSPDTSRRSPPATILPFFVARHLASEPPGDNFALFRRPTPRIGALRRHFCPFSSPGTSRWSPQATLLPLFVARHLTFELSDDTLGL